MDVDISKYREARGLKQYELADMIGVDRGTMSRIESGQYKLSLPLAKDIARALNVPFSIFACRADAVFNQDAIQSRLLLEAAYELDGSLESEGTVLLFGQGHEYELTADDLKRLEQITSSAIEYFDFEFSKFLKELEARSNGNETKEE